MGGYEGQPLTRKQGLHVRGWAQTFGLTSITSAHVNGTPVAWSFSNSSSLVIPNGTLIIEGEPTHLGDSVVFEVAFAFLEVWS